MGHGIRSTTAVSINVSMVGAHDSVPGTVLQTPGEGPVVHELGHRRSRMDMFQRLSVSALILEGAVVNPLTKWVIRNAVDHPAFFFFGYLLLVFRGLPLVDVVEGC